MTEPSTDRNAWTEPGAFEVAPDVFRIPLPLPNDGLRAVNVYAVRTADGFVLVDAGWDIPESRALLAESLGSLGASLGDIRRFLVTHVHRDHYTQAVVVRREFGSSVGLGIGEKPTLDLLQSPQRSPLMGQVRHLHVLGAPDLADTIAGFVRNARPDLDQWESPDEWLQPGEITLTGGRVLEAKKIVPGYPDWVWRLPASTRSPLAVMSCLISRAAVALRWARLRTSEATTAKPRPCSPARAASTAASSASFPASS